MKALNISILGEFMWRRLELDLIAWKDRPHPYPLLIRGARQVGKTYLVKSFMQNYFENSVTINLEQQREFIPCFNTRYPKEILNAIYLVGGLKIIPGKTCLFIDEIQECPEAILALRYFYEDMPELHIIAAGSLLEFTLRQEDFRMPVGRIQSLYLYPLSFDEFLLAKGEDALVSYLQTVTLDTSFILAVHEKLLSLIKEYFLMGGMPAVVKSYIETGSFTDTEMIQETILSTYRGDFGKYSRTSSVRLLQRIYDKAPGLSTTHFKYSDIEPTAQSRDIKSALNDIVDAGLLYKIYASLASGIPLNLGVNEKKFKLLFLDTGLLTYSLRLGKDILFSDDLVSVHKGMVTEQFVGQELIANMPSFRKEELYYWERLQRASTAEVDYLIVQGTKIFPLEVKSGATGRLKSIHAFMDEKNSDLGIVVSQRPLGREGKFLFVPIYMISQIPRLLTLT